MHYYNQTCCKCGGTGNEYTIDGLCFTCAEKGLEERDELHKEIRRLRKDNDRMSDLLMTFNVEDVRQAEKEVAESEGG